MPYHGTERSKDAVGAGKTSDVAVQDLTNTKKDTFRIDLDIAFKCVTEEQYKTLIAYIRESRSCKFRRSPEPTGESAKFKKIVVSATS